MSARLRSAIARGRGFTSPHYLKLHGVWFVVRNERIWPTLAPSESRVRAA